MRKGIFWAICDFVERDNKIIIDSNIVLLYFSIPCLVDGTPMSNELIQFNSKDLLTYNHEKTWLEKITHINTYPRFIRKHKYNYYPRGRVEIKNNKALIYLNGNINKENIVEIIKEKFELYDSSLKSIRIITDNSVHYHCYADNSIIE